VDGDGGKELKETTISFEIRFLGFFKTILSLFCLAGFYPEEEGEIPEGGAFR
jgi:hypothetical protein